MTLNIDLFGNLVPDPLKSVPVSVRRRNKVRVYHSSNSYEPPHSRQHPRHNFPFVNSNLPFINSIYEDTNNIHEDIIHAGTPKSTPRREHVHEYEIDLNHPSVSPVTWGDAPEVLEADEVYDRAYRKTYENIKDGEDGPLGYEFYKNMRGKQEGLFEYTPANVLNAAQTGKVLPYRNRREDVGSISYAIPKSAVGDAVRYIGVSWGDDFRQEHFKEDS